MVFFWGGGGGDAVGWGTLAPINEKTFSLGTVNKILIPHKGGSHYMVLYFGKIKKKNLTNLFCLIYSLKEVERIKSFKHTPLPVKEKSKGEESIKLHCHLR